MSKLTKEYDKLAREAKKLKGKSYPINPEGKHIARAKGNLTSLQKDAETVHNNTCAEFLKQISK